MYELCTEILLTIGTVSPFTTGLAIFQVDKIVLGLIMLSRKRCSQSHDAVGIDHGQFSIAQTCVGRVCIPCNDAVM